LENEGIEKPTLNKEMERIKKPADVFAFLYSYKLAISPKKSQVLFQLTSKPDDIKKKKKTKTNPGIGSNRMKNYWQMLNL
jgi:hypothetical protein